MNSLSKKIIFMCGILFSAFAFRLSAQTTVDIIYHYDYASQNCIIPVNGNFYCWANTTNYQPTDSADFFIDFGDGHDTTIRRVQSFSSSNQATTQSGTNYLQHLYTVAGIYNVTYIVTLPDGNADTTTSFLMINSTCNNITGQIYVDVNNDCLFNSGDFVVPYYNLHLTYNNDILSYGNTDANGQYIMSGCPGYTYTLEGDTSNNPQFQFICSTSLGMPITPSPNYNQDLVAYDTTNIHITSAGDSSAFNIGHCVPLTPYFYFTGNTVGYYSSTDSIDIYYNFGDGNDTLFKTPINNNGPAGYFNSGIAHTYTAAGNYNLMYAATGPDGNSDTIINLNEITVMDTCGNIEGDIYIDNNNNCTIDVGDSVMRWMYVNIVETSTGLTYYAFADSIGHYNISVPPGNYTVSLNTYMLNYLTVTPTCPASGTANVTVTASNTVNTNFGLTCPSSYDLSPLLFVYHGIYPTITGSLLPYISNHSCTQILSSVTLILDPLVHYLGTCDTSFHPTINGDTLTWSFNTANAFYYWYQWYHTSGCITVIGDASLQLGDSVCFTMILNPISGDVNPANNTITRCLPALVALDPNIKEVSPKGTGAPGYIPQSTTLDYTIQFQNTGTASARDIFVLDTLDADLDLSTLVITGSSHYMEPRILPGNVLRFSFPNINLADSTHDEMNSHGFVSYRIAAKPALADGTPIQNKAGIYFDFNPPVITNSTLNTIYDPASVNEIATNVASVFPNPASSTIEINFKEETTGNITLSDLTGKIVYSTKLHGRTSKIDVNALPQGCYLLILETENGRTVHKVIVQH